MASSKSSPGKFTSAAVCGGCAMSFCGYKVLLEHLYWRHGTESVWCTSCGLKKWMFAKHVCHVLPITEDYESEEEVHYSPKRETEYCYCGKFISGSNMIGCDEPKCSFQWYHFQCVGIKVPPPGNWYCPDCIKLHKKKRKRPEFRSEHKWGHVNL